MNGSSAAQKAIEDDVLTLALSSFGSTADPRLREVMLSLVVHVHGFIRDVRLTEQEWESAIAFLTRVGHITDELRQEFVLLFDVLGASTQVVAVNNEAQLNATEATVFGPFFTSDASRVEFGGDISFGAPGEPCWVEGIIASSDGTPIPGARIEDWEADEQGLCDVQYGGMSELPRLVEYVVRRESLRSGGLPPRRIRFHTTVRSAISYRPRRGLR